MPLSAGVEFLDLTTGGFVLCLVLPEHRLRPYQNKITGGFYLRTGAQNKPIPRGQLHALFTPIEKLEGDTIQLMERENAVIEARDIMQNNGATLHIAIVPQEHYERERAPFDPGRPAPKMMRHYHGGNHGVFKGCENGAEVRDATFQEGARDGVPRSGVAGGVGRRAVRRCRADQRATTGRLMRGSSLIWPTLSSVM